MGRLSSSSTAARCRPALSVEDETGFYRHRDFQRMKEEHFYPWLRTLVEVCRRESGKGVSGMQLCWDLEQYAPEDIPDTTSSPEGRSLRPSDGNSAPPQAPVPPPSVPEDC